MFRSLVAVAVAAMMGGCASIVGGHNQSVSVETRTETGAPLTGANCKLANDKGAWFITTPGSTTVQRSFNDMLVECNKEPHPTGITTAKSSTKPLAFGNVIFGGVIGVAVDTASGAAFDYPSLITVQMGKTAGVLATPNAAPVGAPVPSEPLCQAQQQPMTGSQWSQHYAPPQPCTAKAATK